MVGTNCKELLIGVGAAVLFASCTYDSIDSTVDPVVGMQDQEEAKSPFDLLDTTYYTPVESSEDAGGLTIAGENTSEQIRRCKSINGQSILELEKLMRPGNSDERSSTEGFLGPDEKLIDVMVADNEFVRNKGLTHRDLAIPLLQICHRALAARKRAERSIAIEHAGVNWQVDIKEYKGFQYSPFNDDTQTNRDFTITNRDSGATLEFSGLVPIMIERYGFYEGRGTPYRVEPADILRVLGLSPQPLE